MGTVPNTYVVVDLENTGLQPARDRILEIGAWKVVDGKITEKFWEYVNPQMDISERIQELTGISNETVKDARVISEVLPEFVAFCEGFDLLGHNILFDYSFLKQQAVQFRIISLIRNFMIWQSMLPEKCVKVQHFQQSL